VQYTANSNLQYSATNNMTSVYPNVSTRLCGLHMKYIKKQKDYMLEVASTI